jgi:hypothetical protein
MGGSKTAILAQVVHFYFGVLSHITIGGNTWLVPGLRYSFKEGVITHLSPIDQSASVSSTRALEYGLLEVISMPARRMDRNSSIPAASA